MYEAHNNLYMYLKNNGYVLCLDYRPPAIALAPPLIYMQILCCSQLSLHTCISFFLVFIQRSKNSTIIEESTVIPSPSSTGTTYIHYILVYFINIQIVCLHVHCIQSLSKTLKCMFMSSNFSK